MTDDLEEKMILNNDGPSLQATEELIRVLSTVLNSEREDSDAQGYAKQLIEQVRRGYEYQSGDEYTGFFPEIKG